MRVLQWVGCRDLCAIAACSHWGHRVANDDHLWCPLLPPLASSLYSSLPCCGDGWWVGATDRKELFKRDRRKLPYLTDLCFAASPVVLQLSKKPAHKVCGVCV